MVYGDHEIIYKESGSRSVEIDGLEIKLSVGERTSDGSGNTFEVVYVSADSDSAIIIGTACTESSNYSKKFIVESVNNYTDGWTSAM